MATIDQVSRMLLVEFLERGTLGPISVGQPTSVIDDCCGPPDDVYVACPGLEILYYGGSPCGPLQLTMEDACLKTIQIDILGYVTRFRVGILPRFSLPRSLLTTEAFLKFMSTFDIVWRTESAKGNDLLISTLNGTEIWFQDGKLMEIAFERKKSRDRKMRASTKKPLHQ